VLFIEFLKSKVMSGYFNKLKPSVYWLGVIMLLTMSCTKFYKPVEADTSTPTTKKELLSANAQKYLILHQGKYIYNLKNSTIDNLAMTLHAELSSVDPEHLTYVKAKPRKYAYSNPDVLNEFHIYSKDSSWLDVTTPLVLPLDQIDKIELIEHDAKRTRKSNATVGAIITMGAMAAIIVVAIATADIGPSFGGDGCSCPIVSTYDGEQYVLQGELFTGAISPPLERNDYLPLPLQPINGEFQIRITNDVDEMAHIDYAHLSVIEHDYNTSVGIGVDGMTYLISDPVSPTAATLNDNRDMLAVVRQADGMVCNFDDTLRNTSTSELTLTFQAPREVKHAKLVLQLKNSTWLAYIFEDYARHFGNRYNDWQEKMSKTPAGETRQWIEDQQMPLTISISTSAGWKEIEHVDMVGMYANREFVIPLELYMRPDGPFRVKLSTGFLFWELDYAAMDYTMESYVTKSTLSPYYAVDEKGVDVLDQLMLDDGTYLVQPETNNYVTLKYKMNDPVRHDKSYSVILLTKGYYQLMRYYEGKPDVTFLKPFKDPGALSAHSKAKFQSIMNNKSVAQLPK
jgi:hypothetical protein